MVSATVQRYDIGTITGYEEHSSTGALRLWGICRQVGPLTYKDRLGNKRIENVSYDSLSNPRAVNSVFGIPVTIEHPPEFVNKNNIAKYSQGTCGSQTALDSENGHLYVDMFVTHKDAIDGVKSGRLRGLSLGYSAQVTQREDGEFDQTAWEANHLALLGGPPRAPDAWLVDGRVDAAELPLFEPRFDCACQCSGGELMPNPDIDAQFEREDASREDVLIVKSILEGTYKDGIDAISELKLGPPVTGKFRDGKKVYSFRITDKKIGYKLVSGASGKQDSLDGDNTDMDIEYSQVHLDGLPIQTDNPELVSEVHAELVQLRADKKTYEDMKGKYKDMEKEKEEMREGKEELEEETEDMKGKYKDMEKDKKDALAEIERLDAANKVLEKQLAERTDAASSEAIATKAVAILETYDSVSDFLPQDMQRNDALKLDSHGMKRAALEHSFPDLGINLDSEAAVDAAFATINATQAQPRTNHTASLRQATQNAKRADSRSAAQVAREEFEQRADWQETLNTASV